MKKFIAILILGLFAAVLISLRVAANDEGSCCRGMKTGMPEKEMCGRCGHPDKEMNLEEKFYHKAYFILENSAPLGLSEEQVKKIKTLKLNTKKNLIKNNAELEALALDIEAALENEVIDVNGVNALIDKKYAAKSQEAKISLGAYVELKSILSKEQVSKVHEMWKQKPEEKCMLGEGREKQEHKMNMQKKI